MLLCCMSEFIYCLFHHLPIYYRSIGGQHIAVSSKLYIGIAILIH